MKTEPQNIDFKELQKKVLEKPEANVPMNLTGFFGGRAITYINKFALFKARHNAIPNFVHEINIDCRRAVKWFKATYLDEITDFYFNKIYLHGSTAAEPDDIYMMLYEDLIVYFDTNRSAVRFLFRKTNMGEVEQVIANIKKFKEKKFKGIPKISLLIDTSSGVNTISLRIAKTRFNITDNYNTDFAEIHQTIMQRLSRKNDKGLVLLHGKPGTGKTSYIRYLISQLKKDVIFLPSDMAAAITSPHLVSMMVDNLNSVFVIEDAEKIVIDREKDSSSPISALLNLSDGLLSDCLNIQIICSFNTDISKVDSALMRKGRLIAKYEFKELETDKARALSAKLGFRSTINAPMTLTAIYNQKESSYLAPPKNLPIGFKAASLN